ncbi:MAG: M1 family peptidase [Chitinophagaceae bacterium]|nr:M1 family peptidase [Chitinophagaceae bacterium]
MKNFLSFIVAMLAFFFVQAQFPIHQRVDTPWQSNYRSTPARLNDLVHTKLEAKFDYDKSYLYGKVWLTLQSHFYPTDSLALDAKGMEIKKVSLQQNGKDLPLKYTYDSLVLNIKLDRIYKGKEKYVVYIDYIARPNELKVEGSAAITDAKGLYFINPKGEEKNKPTQIWTQGETEATSVWCPTIDNPSQKTTQEFYLTVPKKYVTLSNGKLISQKLNTDNTRTDYWKMDLPHAPYLFFMGVGDFAVVKDSYKGKEVNYYVEKEYAPVAKKIFGNTPEMMAFYSRITGVEYPWNKYSQIVGRDYVSGAMENTTATIHQENAQQDARELVDGNIWESTIAHELFHQWFGDYVTAESWSNLTVNESFANYSETLWDEYKYGKDAGDAQNYNDMVGYLGSGSGDKNLVRFYYSNKEDMFDAVSYNKGGRILHMLRNYLGDSAFFKGLGLYLTNNKFKTGEAHQLRLALEEVSGVDLNWFFDQWYFGSGHPQLDISYSYDESGKKVNVTIRQIQEGSKVFKLPVAVEIYNGGKKIREKIWVDQKEETFSFAYQSKPDLVNVDADKVLLCEKKDNKTIAEFIHQYKYAGNYLDRRESIDTCLKNQNDPASQDLLKLALKDKYYGLRNYALSKLDLKNPTVKQAFEPIILDLVKNDKKALVRAEAISVLGAYGNASYKSLFLAAVKDSSYSVAGAALGALMNIDEAAAVAEVEKIKNQPAKGKLGSTLLQVLIKKGTEADFDIVARNFNAMGLSQEKFEALQPFSQYLTKVNNTEKFKAGIDMIINFREAIPGPYKEQVSGYINDMILSGLINEKKKQQAGANSSAIKEQVDYIQTKM